MDIAYRDKKVVGVFVRSCATSQNVLQIIDLVATDQLIIGKKNSLDIYSSIIQNGNDATGFIGWSYVQLSLICSP
jgi:hypothetical protein